MPPNIMNGTAFLARGERKNIWHGLGDTFDDDPNVTEAFRRATIDQIVVDVAPAIALWPDPKTGEMRTLDTDSAILIRRPLDGDDFPRIFGQPVNRDYQPIQAAELATMLDPVAADGWKLSTVGALGQGETIFTCFEGDKFTVAKKDECTRFFTVANWNNGRRAASAFVSPIRTVCKNTLMAGLAAAELSVKVPHAAGATANLDAYIRLITGIKEAQELVVAQFDLLATTAPFADEEDAWVQEIIRSAFPIKAQKPQAVRLRDALVGDQSLLLSTPVTGDDMGRKAIDAKMAEFQRMQQAAETAEARFEREKARAEAFRTHARGIYDAERGDLSSPAHDLGAAWLAANAVAETVQFVRSTRADAQRELENITFGDGMRSVKAAFAKAGELVTTR